MHSSYELTAVPFRLFFMPADARTEANPLRVEGKILPHGMRNLRTVYRALRKAGHHRLKARLLTYDMVTGSGSISGRPKQVGGVCEK